MNKKNFVNIFLSSKMDESGQQYHSYRSALSDWIEREYPFFNVKLFEKTADPLNFKDWEIKAIRDSALFIGIIFTDSDEVIAEIEMALGFKNPIFLFFFQGQHIAPTTWEKFAIKKGIKSAQPENWEKLLNNLRDSIDEHIIDLLISRKGKQIINPMEPMETI